MKIFVFSAIIFLMNACSTTVQDSAQSTDAANDGFILVETITTKDKAPCDLILRAADGTEYDAVNRDQMIKTVESHYLIKFRGLRQMNRCGNALPVEITELKPAE